MENTIIGEEIKYILTQTNTEEDTTQTIFYNEYNFTMTPVEELEQATKFTDLEMVKGIVSLQNQMAVIMSKPYEYKIVKEQITREEVVEEDII